MMRRILAGLLVVIGLGFGQMAAAADRGTPDEAQALAIKAAAYIKEHGREKAFPLINEKGGPFHDRDLYVFVHETGGLVVAHGGNGALIGKNTVGVKDVDGKTFVKDIVEIKDSGWVDYKWQNPVTKAVEPKTVYVVNQDGLVICAGAYKNP